MEYVESGYVEEGYVESQVEDSNPSTVNCDLSNIEALLTQISNRLSTLESELSLVKTKVNSNNQISLSMSSKLTDLHNFKVPLDEDVKLIRNSVYNLAQNSFNLDEVKSLVPTVSDYHVTIFREGTNVTVAGFDTVGEVVSSRFTQYGELTYMVMYSVKHVVDGETIISDFPAVQVSKFDDEVTEVGGGFSS